MSVAFPHQPCQVKPGRRSQVLGRRFSVGGRRSQPSAPAMVLSICGLTLASALERCGGLPRDLYVVELWSGVGAVARAARKVGAAAQEFDINRVPGATDTDDPELTENILLEAGFLRALSLAMRLRKGGLLWMAPVCASWVFLCISRTKRHKAARYEGNVGCASVRDGNQMACMAALLYSVAFARGVDVVLENPSSSTIFMYGPLVDVLAAVGPDKKSTAVCPHCTLERTNGLQVRQEIQVLGHCRLDCATGSQMQVPWPPAREARHRKLPRWRAQGHRSLSIFERFGCIPGTSRPGHHCSLAEP